MHCQTILDKANGAKIPVFGSEIEQVKSGCVASDGNLITISLESRQERWQQRF